MRFEVTAWEPDAVTWIRKGLHGDGKITETVSRDPRATFHTFEFTVSDSAGDRLKRQLREAGNTAGFHVSVGTARSGSGRRITRHADVSVYHKKPREWTAAEIEAMMGPAVLDPTNPRWR